MTSTAVLTAAHCQTPLLLFLVVLAEHDVSREDGEVPLHPLQWVSHPDYDSRQVCSSVTENENSCEGPASLTWLWSGSLP